MTDAVRFEAGFFDLETHSGFPFRWMARVARVGLETHAEPAFLEISARGYLGGLGQSLTASVDGSGRQTLEVVRGWNRLSFAVASGASGLELATERSLPPELRPGDGRALALQVREAVLHGDPKRHARVQERHQARVRALRELRSSPAGALPGAADEVRCAEGCHILEAGEDVAYRWIERRARLQVAAREGASHLEFWLSSPFRDLSQRVTVEVDGARPEAQALAHGGNLLSVEVPPGRESVWLTVNKAVPASTHPGDERELAAQLRSPLRHDDAQRHAQVRRQQANRIRNSEELLAGAVRLRSTPPKLGIDLEGRCNINPPCVYCEWDWNKGLEGDNAQVPFDLAKLRAQGGIFDNSSELINCSIGEPFMIRDIDAVLDAFGRSGKLFEASTNGQILTSANVRRLLGRHIHLYVSLDAATAGTYARLRNGRFESVVDNVQRLIDAKGGPGSLPLVFLVFMPMRANLHEVDAFVELAAELQVDRLALRPLNASEGTNLVWDRGGYHFDYQRELLPFEELVRVSGRVAELCRAFGVQLSNQLSFGGEVGQQFHEAYERGRSEAAAVLAARAAAVARPVTSAEGARAAVAVREASGNAAPGTVAPPTAAAEPAASISRESAAEEPRESDGTDRLPICTEPWTSLYVLRRGVLPCCFGGAPIAPMRDFARAWNSPLVRDIRRALRAGRFHPYCLGSPGCPIVRKAEQGRALATTEMAWRAGQPADLRGGRFVPAWPRRVYHGTRRALAAALARGRRVMRRS